MNDLRLTPRGLLLAEIFIADPELGRKISHEIFLSNVSEVYDQSIDERLYTEHSRIFGQDRTQHIRMGGSVKPGEAREILTERKDKV